MSPATDDAAPARTHYSAGGWAADKDYIGPTFCPRTRRLIPPLGRLIEDLEYAIRVDFGHKDAVYDRFRIAVARALYRASRLVGIPETVKWGGQYLEHGEFVLAGRKGISTPYGFVPLSWGSLDDVEHAVFDIVFTFIFNNAEKQPKLLVQSTAKEFDDVGCTCREKEEL